MLKTFRPVVWLVAIGCCAALSGWTQTFSHRPRITTRISESRLETLRNNVHPLARAENESGAVPADLPMDRMLLVLQRSGEQESALEKFLEDQQDPASSKYHQWLTPEQFGEQFGANDADVQTVSAWLQTHGFKVNQVAKGRTHIEFSGTAAQVEQAFHTQLRKYVVDGEEHIANATDPQIPAALAGVVAGVSTLHNFAKGSQLNRMPNVVTANLQAGRQPEFNGANGAHYLTPTDYSFLYDLQRIYTDGIRGAGATIAIVGRSNVDTSDINSFRSTFALPENPPQVVVNGIDPGNLGGDEEAEAVLDLTWAGALAPNATVKLITSKSTKATDGVDLSEEYIINNNLGDVMSESFGECEANFTQAQAIFYSNLARQAAAQGITFIVAAGDSGASGCDAPSSARATKQISVNMLAASPYVTAVGGTMFNESGNDSTYWFSYNYFGRASVIGPIPEKAWNESCGDAACGTSTPGLWAGGGGASRFFAKPSWQTGLPGILADNSRDLPDVALTAAGHDAYLLCLKGSCTPDSIGRISFAGGSGTSAAAPSFAGMIALVVQKYGSRQGQINPNLYRLARTQDWSQCNSSNHGRTGNFPCIFTDVTTGDNAVPGQSDYRSAAASYQARFGYDLATGLGSINASNLVLGWKAIAGVTDDSWTVLPRFLPLNAQLVGTTTTSVVKLSNLGNITLHVAKIAFSGQDLSDFDQTNDCHGSVPPSSSCTINVLYTPSQIGHPVIASLDVYMEGYTSPLATPISGFASSSSTATISDTTVNFGDQKLMSWSEAQTVTIANSTASTITIDPITFTGENTSDFTFLNTFGSTLDSGKNCAVTLIFNPKRLGLQTATLTITESSSPAPHVIPVTGTGALSGSFLIVSGLDAKALEVANASKRNGALLQQYSVNGGEQQQWRFDALGNGYYTITNVGTGKVLDVTGGFLANGVFVQQWDGNGNLNQQWQLIQADDVHFKIVNRLSGKLLDLTNSWTDNGMPIQQWQDHGGPQQLWSFVPATPYTITNLLSAAALEASGAGASNGTWIDQSAPDGLRQQQWYLMPVGGGDFAILNRLSGKALDVFGGYLTDTTKIQQWDYLRIANQHWQLAFSDATHAAILNRQSGKALDDSDYSLADGTVMQQFTYIGGSNQQWQLTPVTFYNIVSRSSGMALGLQGGAVSGGTLIEQAPLDGSIQQQWEMLPTADGYYALLNNLSSKALDVRDDSGSNGALIQQYDYLSATNQQWQVMALDGGYSEIRSRGSRKVLDLIGGYGAAGTNIQQWAYLGGQNQQWQLIPVN